MISMTGGGVGRQMGSASAAMQLEALQAQLKQKEGTIIQHQMDLAGMERAKEGSDLSIHI